jgi:drug/metabolite transporter (DMT)-like permease
MKKQGPPAQGCGAAGVGALAYLAVLGGATGIAFAPVLVRLSETGPSATAFYRLLFALPFLWSWNLLTHKRDPTAAVPSSPRDFFYLTLAGLFFTGDLVVWHWSLQFTSVANSTLLTNIAPIFVTLGAWLLFQEQITRRFIAGMFLALTGSAGLTAARLDFRGEHWWGDTLAIITALFYAGYQLSLKQLREKFATATIMAWSGLVCCPAFLLIAALSQETLEPRTGQGWAVLIALAILSHVIGQTVIAYAFGHLPASFTSLCLLLQPVLAALLAIPILGESITPLQLAGGLIVLVGIALASGRFKKSVKL